jgi:hypothetical protein
LITQTNLLALVEQEKITREALEVRLTPEQIELLDTKVQVALWHRIDAFNAFLRISSEINGSSPRSTRRAIRVTSARTAPDHVIFHGRPADS